MCSLLHQYDMEESNVWFISLVFLFTRVSHFKTTQTHKPSSDRKLQTWVLMWVMMKPCRSLHQNCLCFSSDSCSLTFSQKHCLKVLQQSKHFSFFEVLRICAELFDYSTFLSLWCLSFSLKNTILWANK